MIQVENYMVEHGFENTDKQKVRSYLQKVNATNAYLTRKTLMWVDRSGSRKEIERKAIGVRTNTR